MKLKNTGVVITAAGLSSRMGRPKSMLQFGGGQTFVERLVEVYAGSGCSRIALVVNDAIPPSRFSFLDPMPCETRVIVNPDPGSGRFASIQMGLDALTGMEYGFVQSVDNPFVDRELLWGIYAGRMINGYSVPAFRGRTGHPVLVGRDLMSDMQKVEARNGHFREFLSGYPVNIMETNDERIFVNINTPAQYANMFGG